MDKKLTDSEIVKALEDLKKCNNNEIDCGSCSLSVFYPRCPEEICELSLDLINRLQAENKEWKRVVETWQELHEKDKAENERLKNALTDHEYGNCVAVKNGLIYTHTLEDYDELIGDISAEAYKTFTERLKEKSKIAQIVCSGALITTNYTISAKNLNNLLKELVGDK